MKRVYLMVVATLLSITAMFAQVQNKDLSGTYSGKMKYVPGKNTYLLDEYKLDYTYKVVMGNPQCLANVSWTRNTGFVVNKKAMTYAKVSEYDDLQLRYDLLAPDSITFSFTMMMYSDQSKAYIASAKTSITVPYIEKVGSTMAPEYPIQLSWVNAFSDVVVGKQQLAKPGVVIPDATLEKSFEGDRLKSGKLDSKEKFFGFRMRKLFSLSSKIEIVNVSVNVKWNDADYKYITDEYDRRKSAAKYITEGNYAQAGKVYFENRTTTPAIRKNGQLFWMSTVAPSEVWMTAVQEGDKLYAQGKWVEAGAYYQSAAKANPDLSYPVARLQKIKGFVDYKNNRNVGDLELVYVEGGKGVKSFYMSKTEITQAQWIRIMGTRPSNFKGRNNPVENISWEEAQAFIKELNRQTGMNYRLPRADEWEYAAKGGSKSISTEYSGSDNLPDVAWCAYNSSEQTHEVATKSPNELGLYDMTGNVSEWVVDQYDKTTRMVKGGSWSDDATGCVIGSTEKLNIKYKSSNVGFRVCQDE